MTEIDSTEAREKHGIYCVHQQMPNREFRFRLKKVDGTGYIRTEASGVGAWQESHYHKQVRETYIVQAGWMAYAERLPNGQPEITIHREGGLFTTQPGIIHNVFMPANSVIHTIKHGMCNSEDRRTDGTEEFDRFCTGLTTEEAIISYAVQAASSARPRARYSEEYQHFDKLIWQVPAWATAIFALSLQGLGADSVQSIAKVARIPADQLATVFLFGLSLMILCFSHVMYRFRVHQRSLKEYRGSSPFKSASTYTHAMVVGQAVFLSVLGLLSTKHVPLWAAIAFGFAWFAALTVSREVRLRCDADAISR